MHICTSGVSEEEWGEGQGYDVLSLVPAPGSLEARVEACALARSTAETTRDFGRAMVYEEIEEDEEESSGGC